MGLFSTGAGAVQRDASNAAAARQGRGANLTGFIDNIFQAPGREAGIQDFMGALRSQYGDATNRGFADSSRRSKFATARQGLTGGSVDVTRQGRGIEDLFRRRISDEARVQDAGNDLRTQDMATRQSLINSAYGTADVGQDALRSLLGRRASNAGQLTQMWPDFASSLGGDLAGAYRQRAEMDAYRRGLGGG